MLKHFSHQHSLILNEIYHAKEGDMCYVCNEQIVSCRLFVYSCINTSTSNVDEKCLKFLLHKSCAELPLEIRNPKNQEQFLFLEDERNCDYTWFYRCAICNMTCKWFRYHNRDGDLFIACVKCAMFQLQSLEEHKYDHPGHSRHPLTLVQYLASFRCYACQVDDNIKDLSYMCTKCSFRMHKNCADAPTSFQFQFHNQHPLILSFSLPQIYRKFHQYCKICKEELSWLDWLYYCPNCRFFAHFHCARSNPMLSEEEMYDPDLVHLPAADESAVNLLFEQFVKALSSQLNHKDVNSIYSAAKGGIKHWSHDEHDLQVMTTNELSDGKDDDDDEETLLLCDGCVKPIPSDGGVLHGCVRCKYFLHKVCAELPRDIKHHVWAAGSSTLSARKYKVPYESFLCECCGHMCNGIYFKGGWDKYEIGCVSLPKIIKHEAHPHQLNQINTWDTTCKACGDRLRHGHRCERCDFDICGSCIMKPRTHKHPWDRHPLQLIYDPSMVSEHQHDYNCEYCSQDIDTNTWFYHCSDCDLSFHLRNDDEDECFERSCNYLDRRSNLKFGASDIKIDELHPHSLTFVLNKKVRSCKRCCRPQLGQEVLECAPCKAIFCSNCNQNQGESESD